MNLNIAGLALVPLLALHVLNASADATLDKLNERHRVSVGVMLTGLPFGTLDPKTQQPVGYNVELANELGKRLGVAVETVAVLPPNRVQFLQQGKVDVLIANMQYTDERAQILDYPPTPYEQVGGAAVIRKGAGIKQWADLAGKPVCVSQGSNFIEPLQQYGAQIKAFRSQAESLLSLRGNGCVAAVHVAPTMRALLNQDEWAGYESPLPTELIPSDSVMWVRKGEHDFQARVDAIIRDWHRSGWLIDLGKRTGMEPSQALYALHDRFKDSAPLQALP
ncbi:transporter substrate-binding domain-containing protein [Pseudomonas sp. RIT-PI-S]|uniref:transporter substrate-binding domain-containing protein n=1 Tax=Pseudomonas sp. RIT-PI-S TaxID=3035295 RepID=UPI0021DAFEC0|nr:transporter substrate-binding domain-containing protein [Pseudomonas sp. RIT-PI-S]